MCPPNNTYHRTHLHATPDLPNNAFHLPQWAFPHKSFIHTHTNWSPNNTYHRTHLHATPNLSHTYHHTHCTNGRASPYPLSNHTQHQTYHRYTWAPQWGELAGVLSGPAPVASGTGRVAFGNPTRALATVTSPARNHTNNPQQYCSCLPNNIASAPGMHPMVPSLRLPAPGHRLLKHRPGGKPSQQCNHSVLSLASRFLRCT